MKLLQQICGIHVFCDIQKIEPKNIYSNDAKVIWLYKAETATETHGLNDSALNLKCWNPKKAKRRVS